MSRVTATLRRLVSVLQRRDLTGGTMRVPVVCGACGQDLNAWVRPGPEATTTWICPPCGAENKTDLPGKLKGLAYLSSGPTT